MQATNSAGRDKVEGSLLVQAPPRWVREPKDAEVSSFCFFSHEDEILSWKVVAGEDVELVCVATGQPPPNVTWVKEGDSGELRVTLEQTEEEVVASVMVGEAGQYLCLASNGVGDPIAAKVSLTLHYKPAFAEDVNQLEVVAGKGIEVLCSAEAGDPPIEYTWTREGLSLPAKLTPTGSVISLSSLRSSDTGPLTCRANNSYGVASKTFQLAVLDVPRAPIGVSVSSVSARDAFLSWRGPHDAMPPILTFVLRYMEEEGGVSQEVVVLPGKGGSKLRGLRPGSRS